MRRVQRGKNCGWSRVRAAAALMFEKLQTSMLGVWAKTKWQENMLTKTQATVISNMWHPNGTTPDSKHEDVVKEIGSVEIIWLFNLRQTSRAEQSTHCCKSMFLQRQLTPLQYTTPVTTVENVRFKQLIKVAEPRYQLQGRKHPKRDKYLCSDCCSWTSHTSDPYMSLTSHFIETALHVPFVPPGA